MVKARKPLCTYKSPSPSPSLLIILPFPPPSSHSSHSSSPAPPSHASTSATSATSSYTPFYHPKPPPLPLFHPFGPLAMSLPPLDPAEYGLPMLPVPDTLSQQVQAKNRRTSTKPRDAEDAPSSVHPLHSSSTATQEHKEKSSPRKRRFGVRRKRKDPEDGDATYPAKRTRVSRNTGAHRDAANEESPPESALPDPIDQVPDTVEKRKRRTGRAWSSTKRQESSASEASLSPPPSLIYPAATDRQDTHDPDAAPIPSPSPIPTPHDLAKSEQPADHAPTEDDEKEDGEISEEHPNP